MAVTEPPGDFNYLFEALGDTDDVGGTRTDLEFEDDDFGFDDGYRIDRQRQQPPGPWYRATSAMVAIGAIGIAGIAILVSAVLLMSRDSRGPASTVESTTATATTPSSAAPQTTPPPVEAIPPRPTESPSPPPPPPPPPSTAGAPPVVVEPQRTEPPKPPEIGVTRTQVTRYPISVSPQPMPHY